MSSKAVVLIQEDIHVFHSKQRDNQSLQCSMIMRRDMMASFWMNGRGGTQCRRGFQGGGIARYSAADVISRSKGQLG